MLPAFSPSDRLFPEKAEGDGVTGAARPSDRQVLKISDLSKVN